MDINEIDRDGNILEPRKIQKVGYNSLSLTLPKGWTHNQHINHGDTLFCTEEEDGSMRLIPGHLAQQIEEDEGTPFVIEADKFQNPGLVEKLIIGNYILGRNHIEVRSDSRISNRLMEEIRSAVNHLMGIGIMEETSQCIVLQTAIDREQFTVNTLLKRLYNLIASMVSDVVEALQTLDWEIAKNVVRREEEADKLYWLIIRLIQTVHKSPQKNEAWSSKTALELMGNRAAAKDIESIGDSAEAIAKLISTMKQEGQVPPPEQIYKQIQKISSFTESILKDAISALLSRDLVLANKALSQRNKALVAETELRDQLNEYTSDPRVIGPLYTVATHLHNITSFASSIANFAIDRSMDTVQ